MKREIEIELLETFAKGGKCRKNSAHCLRCPVQEYGCGEPKETKKTKAKERLKELQGGNMNLKSALKVLKKCNNICDDTKPDIKKILEAFTGEEVEEENGHHKGQKFINNVSGVRYILADMGDCICLTNLNDGDYFRRPVDVDDCDNITQDEFKKICDFGNFTLIEED